MSFISKEDMQRLREDIKKHYGVDIPDKITRVEFVGQGGGCTYMHTDDRFEPPKPPEEKTEYLLHIMDGADTRILPFKSEQRLKAAFDSFKMLEQYGLAAAVNGETKWKFTPK